MAVAAVSDRVNFETCGMLYAALLAGTGPLTAGLVFNWLFAVMVLLILTSGYVCTRYTRDNVGYLTGIVPGTLIPVTVWFAVSPQTIFTPLPWLMAAIGSAIGAEVQIAG
ncbi:MAG: hypothetical protein WAL97_00395 [Halobacteriota archaeon]|jgi:hypothetical protein